MAGRQKGSVALSKFEAFFSWSSLLAHRLSPTLCGNRCAGAAAIAETTGGCHHAVVRRASKRAANAALPMPRTGAPQWWRDTPLPHAKETEGKRPPPP